jgi:hypothetical protein
MNRDLVFKTSAASLYRPGLRGSIAWIRTTISRLNRAADYLLSHDGIKTGLPGRTHTCDLRVRSSAFCNLNYGELKLVGHLGSAPSVFPFQTGRIAIFLVPANWRPGPRTCSGPSSRKLSGRVCCSSSEPRNWWVMVVTLHSSSSDLV